MAFDSFTSIDESARRQFEAHWSPGPPERLSAYLPPRDDPRYLATLEELVLIDLELSRKRAPGSTTTLDGYLSRFPELDEPSTRDRLRAELERHRPAPTSIPHYEIIDELGRGGMGVVYRARHRSLGRVVALKMLLSTSANHPEERDRFRREVESVAQLQHPNIVQLYEVGEHEGRLFCALELAPGGSLAARLAGVPRSATEAAGLLLPLARGTQFAHDHGVLHRDLKPANILLDAQGTPKIADFGLAKRLDEQVGQTQSGTLLGSPSYMAPEQASAERSVGPLADVYGLGAILYEMLTGRPPFRAATILETVKQVVETDPVPPSQLNRAVPRDLETICLKCLSKEPGARYASAGALADDLERFLAGKAIVARPVGVVRRTIKWARRRPTAAGLWALSLLVGIGLIGAVAWNSARLQRERTQEKERAELAERLRAEAERERARAEENFRLAFEAVEHMLDHAQHGPLAGTPLGEHAMRALLEDALEFCKNFLRQKGEDPTVRRYGALAFRLTGDIQRRLGNHVMADENYRAALDLHHVVIEKSPQEPVLRLEFAATLTNRAVLLDEQNRAAEALYTYERARDVRQQLSEDFPASIPYRRWWASSLDNLGSHHAEHGRPKEAETQFLRAYSILRSLYQESPGDADVRSSYANVNANLGMLHRIQVRWSSAEKYMVEAARLQQGLAQSFPREPRYRFQWANSLNMLGLVLADGGRTRDAESRYLEAIALQRTLTADFPSIPAYHAELGGTLHNLAVQLANRDALPEARRALDEAIIHQQSALRANPLNPLYRHFLANQYAALGDVLVSLGDHAAACESATKLFEANRQPGDAVDAAGIIAQCVLLAGKDTKLPAEIRTRTANTYGEQAVQLLREAIKLGFRDGKRLRDSKSFESIRQRDDFQKALATIKER